MFLSVHGVSLGFWLPPTIPKHAREAIVTSKLPRVCVCVYESDWSFVPMWPCDEPELVQCVALPSPYGVCVKLQHKQSLECRRK